MEEDSVSGFSKAHNFLCHFISCIRSVGKVQNIVADILSEKDVAVSGDPCAINALLADVMEYSQGIHEIAMHFGNSACAVPSEGKFVPTVRRFANTHKIANSK